MIAAFDKDVETLLAIKRDFENETQKLVRQLSLAGIALAWLFRITTQTEATRPVVLPRAVALALALFVLALLLDLLRHMLGAVLLSDPLPHLGWGATWKISLADRLTRRIDTGSVKINHLRPLVWSFWLSVVSSFGGYIALCSYLFALVRVR